MTRGKYSTSTILQWQKEAQVTGGCLFPRMVKNGGGGGGVP